MERASIKAFFDASKVVEAAIGALPHRDAVQALASLEEMRELVAEELPGFEYVECIGCKGAKGIDEMVDCGGERLCTDCAADLGKEAA